MWYALAAVIVIIFVLWWLLSRNASRTEVPMELKGEAKGEGSRKTEVQVPTMEAIAEEEVSAPVVQEVPATTVMPDNLEIIEGIGPKIAQILSQVGIQTFSQLAATQPEKIKEILLQAGLRLGDPTTWPEQARLAAAGDMEGLQKLQDSLKGGRSV